MGCRQVVRHGILAPTFEGSNPSTPAIYFFGMCQQLSWIEQRPSKAWVGGSNPSWHTTIFKKPHGGCSSVGQSARLWLQRSWVRIPPFTPQLLKLNRYDPVAQLVEHKTFNLGVPGSSPGWITSGHGGIGRRARLRIQFLRSGSSSLFARTIIKEAPFSGCFFYY